MFNWLKDIDNYDQRKIEKTTLPNGLQVSTAYTNDMGYETAILDSVSAHPVERYETKEQAIEGHTKWVLFAQDGVGKHILELGHPGFDVKDREIILVVTDRGGRR